MNTLDSPTLEQLIHSQPHLWRGHSRASHHLAPVINTGFPKLNKALPDGGWPTHGLMEWIVPHWGVGELSLLLPLLLHFNLQSRWCSWLCAPYSPCAQTLAQQGLDLRYLLLIPKVQSSASALKQTKKYTQRAKHSEQHPDQNLFWSMEKLLANPTCGITLAWPQQPTLQHLRRIHLAATNGHNLAVVFQQKALTNTPTPLRIKLTSSANQNENPNSNPQALRPSLKVEILKARGSLSSRSLQLDL